jgi:uncharacterized surface protein with fasciclin (FAS1) repeats
MVIPFLLFNSCQEEPQFWKVGSEKQVIGDYIANNPQQFSEFHKLIQITGLESLLNTRGPFTLFLPTDEAMLEYYSFKGVSSLEDFSDSDQKVLVFNHIVGAEISCNDIGLGTLRETNAIGDYVVTEFKGADIIVNKHSKIIDRDIQTANGYIHVIDRVMDPITDDIYTVVSSDPSCQIFAEGLRLTGLKDTLQIISFPFGQKEARTRFTVLAVADTIYHRYGIHSAEELMAWCGASPDSVMFLNNPFYRYIEYHCMTGSYYLSDLNTGIYPILSGDNNISFTIDTDYKINYDRDTDAYTGFNIPSSNIPAKNGALHAVDDIMPVTEPEPATILFETTDFFDLKQGDYYLTHYERFFDGENTFEKIKWNGDYLLYYYNEKSVVRNYHCLSMQGWWEISITFPKVMKGKYEVKVHEPPWSLANCAVYLDGVRQSYVYDGYLGITGGASQKIADADFKTTAEHTITLRNTMVGMLFWDYVEFVPVK